MPGPKRPVAGKRIARAEWVARAVKLAIKGWSLRRIAAVVDRDHTTVAEALSKEFERVRPAAEEVETLRNIQREQLQRQLGAWIPLSLAGDKDAALAVTRFLDRFAKLNGLDAPSRSEVTGRDGAPIVFDLTGMSIEQLQQLAAGLAEDDPADEAGAPEPDPSRVGTEEGSDGEPS